MSEDLVNRLRSLAGMLPQKHTLPSGADTVICSLEAFMQIKELAEEAANALEELSKPRWIPVTERLPEDRSDVLAYLKYEVGGRIAAANYDKGMWQDCVMGGLYRTEEGVVTHWMPIPEPPKEEAKNFCGDCHWYEAEEMYCFRQGCHAYDESSCEFWEPMPADEPIPAPGGKTVPTTYDLLYEEGGPDA